MKKLVAPLALVLALVPLAGIACAQEAETSDTNVDNSEARKERILANLKEAIPQLAQVPVTVGPLEATEFDGLQQGQLQIQGRNQPFLISADDTKLWLIAGEPIDASRSAEDIAAAQAEEAQERQAKLAEAAAGEPLRGGENAPVTIVEFSDFQCPFCSRGAQTVEQILDKYGEDVRFVFQHFPLDRIHPWARPAAVAAECAANQSGAAFWELHDAYFADQGQLNTENVIEKSKEYLADTGIDMAQWETCATDDSSEAHQQAAATVQAELELGQELGVSGTPGFFVNGEFVNGAQPLSHFEPIIERELGPEAGDDVEGGSADE